MKFRGVWLAGALLLLGCSVNDLNASSSGPPPARNRCSSNDECGGGLCRQGACVAAQGEFENVLFEVTPPASSGKGLSGIHFLKTMQLPTQGSTALDLALDLVSTVSGTVTPDSGTPSSDAQCSYTLTFTPAEQVLGLAATSYTATTDGSNAFSLDMPAGDYSLYIQPSPVKGGICKVPPILMLHQQIQAGDVMLPILMPPPEHLQVDVLWPKNQPALTGWTIDVVDPITLDVLSVPITLGSSQLAAVCSNAGDICYEPQLEFSTVMGSNSTVGHELVRLSPPAGTVAPTVLMDRSALQVLTKDTVVVDQLTSLPPVVTLQGRVEVGTSSAAARASVTLAATQIQGLPSGTLASFVRTLETSSTGAFQAQVLPGTYNVQAVPDASDLAISTASWQVGASPSTQAGKVIGLAHAAQLTGSVSTPGGDPLVGASVVATASPAATNSAMTVGALSAALGETSPPPRAASELIGSSGLFNLNVDPGVFDLSVQPPDGTGFAWLVRPSVQVGTATEDMQHMTAPLPVVYSGTVTVDRVRVPGALVRAYIYLDKSQGYVPGLDQAASMLQIAETRATDNGTFKLLLPSHLN